MVGGCICVVCALHGDLSVVNASKRAAQQQRAGCVHSTHTQIKPTSLETVQIIMPTLTLAAARSLW
jgi:hypothetical protein